MKIKQCNNQFIELTTEQYHNLEEYTKCLKRWNGLNLIARSTEDDIFNWHIFDALSIYNLVANTERKIVDFGAGGGILGACLAYMGKDIIFVERSVMKTNFLRDIMKFPHVYEHYDFHEDEIVVVRGVSSIHNILNCLNVDKLYKMILLKSCDLTNEIKDAYNSWHFEYEIYSRQARPAGSVIVMNNIRKLY